MKILGKVGIVLLLVLLFLLSFLSFQGLTQHYLSSGSGTKAIELPEEVAVEPDVINKDVVEIKDLSKEEEDIKIGSDQQDKSEEEQEKTKEKDKDNKDNKEDKEKVNNVEKTVYLTFDDGPTKLTLEVVRVLRENNVNATFFTIGYLMERHPDVVRETYDAGNMILTHSYSHNYSIYSTFDTFYKDLQRVEDVYENVLDFNAPPIFRFPGGSSNHSSFNYGGKEFMPNLTGDIKEKGYYYIDWNVFSGDTFPDYDNREKLLSNVIDGSKGKDTIVALFHDVDKNGKLIEILPEIISYYKDQGYVFKTFKDITQKDLDRMVDLKLANKPIVR